MTMWLNDRPPTPVGAVEPWQLESTATTSTTARAAIERRLVAEAMGGIGTFCQCTRPRTQRSLIERDRKSTRLNSSHTVISYAVFCLKKKKTKHKNHNRITTQYSTRNAS